MISIKNLKGGKAGGAADVARYCEHRHDSEKGVGYYSGDGAPSFWHGAGALALGLEGPVKRDDLVAVLEGRLPDGTDLTKRGNVSNRRMGVDITISSPKSPSLQALAGGDERIPAAHDRVVQRVLNMIEREVLTARLGKGGATREYTGSMIAACYRHEDSRPVNGHVDMLIHTHCIIANATQRADGLWSAMDLQFGEQSVLQHLADFHYKNEFARELQAMGYDIRRTEDGFELAHISDEQIERFSQRKGQIDDELIKRNLTRENSTAAQRAAANLATREDKAQGDKSGQQWAWRQEAREAGVNLDRPAAGYAVTAPDLSVEAVKSGTRHLAERETVFSRDALRLEALKAGMGAVTLGAVDAALDAGAAGLLDAGKSATGRQQFTTKDALHREQHILQRARAGQGQVPALMSREQAQRYIAGREQAQGFKYSAGQRAALMLGLTSADRHVGIVGAAGAGKTTAMAGVVDAARGRGYEIIGIAPSAAASHELKSAGCDDTRTLASLLKSSQASAGAQRLYILDEAGMVSARDLDALMARVESEGARLVLVGDPRQLRAVEAGLPFAQMIESKALQHANIDEIQRQRDPKLRDIAQHFARGEAKAAVAAAQPYISAVEVTADDFAAAQVTQEQATIDQKDPAAPTQGMIDYAESLGMENAAGSTFQDVREYLDAHSPKRLGLDEQGPKAPAAVRREAIARQVAADYLSRDKATRDRTLVLSGTNAVRALVNGRIRNGLRENGEIAKTEIRVTALDKSRMTHEQKSRAESYRPDMVVRLQEGKGKARQEHEYTVERVADDRVILRGQDGQEKTWDPAREPAAGVYDKREMGLAAGDQIIFKENRRDVDRIRNGETAKIVRVESGRAVARMTDGREIGIDPDTGQTIDYAWCRTVHAAQGATVDHVLIAGEASRVATAETAYVAASRERDSLTIYTDSAAALSKNWEKWTDKQHARDATHARDPELSKLPELRRAAQQELGRGGDLAKAREREAESALAGELAPRKEKELDVGLELERRRE